MDPDVTSHLFLPKFLAEQTNTVSNTICKLGERGPQKPLRNLQIFTKMRKDVVACVTAFNFQSRVTTGTGNYMLP